MTTKEPNPRPENIINAFSLAGYFIYISTDEDT
jgi:hypothetical protein